MPSRNGHSDGTFATDSQDRSMKAAFGPGTTFSNYRVDSLLGRGGMGVVYLAHDESLERPVALKLIAPELLQDDEFRARFLREPKLAASLDHPNVIPIYEAGEYEGQLYLAMRYVKGTDLRATLEREGRLSPERAIGVLAQVAAALDAAHQRRLVHRDVKPANILIDEDGHPYLTDFGITKVAGGDSTDTGQMVGTLDYLAPEQIRGEQVDGSTDCYALACVLYECLAGTPPFRRRTEGETLWAHMQGEPAPLRGKPELNRVLARALAKEQDERYESCGAFVDAAAAALGVAAPRVSARGAKWDRRRLAPALLVGGGVLLLAAVAAGIVALQGGDDGTAGPLGNGVAAIDPANGSVTSFTKSEAPPGNIAVGEGGVWTLDNEAKTVSRIDPDTKDVTETFETPGVPSELAVGEGALWIGIAGGRGDTNATVRVVRMDPDDGRVTRTIRLGAGDQGVFPVAGVPRIAVGAGAVWAANPDGGVSRIDPKSGRLVATIETELPALTIAAGDAGVWFLDDTDDTSSVVEIDTRRNREGRRIPVGATFLRGIAVGAGSVWAAASDEGVIWRIIPERPAITRTIDVGRGVTFVTFGEGAAWSGNYVDGTVARIDPRTNQVSARASVGAPQTLAAGAGAAWVSVAGGTTEGALTASGCGEVLSGPGTPDLLIASDFPLQGPASSNTRAVEAAIRQVLEGRGFKAGEYTVGYQSCDVSTPQTGGFEFRKCAANASAFAHAEKLVAVLGPWSSYCGQVGIPIMNRAPGGPLAVVSPVSTHAGLTRRRPAIEKGEPNVYYPTGKRNFARVMAREDLQGVANAMLAKELGLKRMFMLYPRGDSATKAEFADPFLRAARRLGIRVAGAAGFGEEPRSKDRLADRVARSGAEGVYIPGLASEGAPELLESLRARLGPRFKIMTHDPFFPIADMLDFFGPSLKGLYFSSTDVPPGAQPPAGRRFARDSGTLAAPMFGVLQAGQATELVLDAIGRSDGTRASVLEQVRDAKVENGILGDFRIVGGDITPARLSVFRVTGATPPGEAIFEQYNGAEFDRVISVPASLSG